MSSSFCGIDFGTSNSTVGIWQNNAPVLSQVEGSNNTIPSAIFYDFEENTVGFGRFAIDEYLDEADGRLMRALKSVLGTPLMDEKTKLHKQRIAFIDIIETFLKHLKIQAEQHNGCELTQVVLGRPVHFIDDKPDADMAAQNAMEAIAKNVGFIDISFQYEPIAAALDYEQNVDKEKTALIIDIGGGTSDFSIVKVSPEGHAKADRKNDVLANTGVHIGGTDFDKHLSMLKAMPEFGYGSTVESGKTSIGASYYYDLATWQKINFLYTPKIINEIKQQHFYSDAKEQITRLIKVLQNHQGHSIAIEVEKAKVDVATNHDGLLHLDFVEKGLNIPIVQNDLNTAIQHDVDRIKETVQETLKAAQLTPSEIDAVFLTGGSTNIPLVKNTVTALFPDAEIINGDVFGSVGIGLALDAKRKFG